jgi:hypothetical protein
MAKQATEELNTEARLHEARLEEVRSEKNRIEKALEEEQVRENQIIESVRENERAEEIQEVNARAIRESQNTEQQDFNRLPTVDEERDIKREEADNRHKTESDYIEAAAKLNQAKSYNRIGASVISRSNEMIGSMLDISV